MRGLQTDRTASVVIRGHAVMQNLRREYYELGAGAPPDSASRPHSTNSQQWSEIRLPLAPSGTAHW